MFVLTVVVIRYYYIKSL